MLVMFVGLESGLLLMMNGEEFERTWWQLALPKNKTRNLESWRNARGLIATASLASGKASFSPSRLPCRLGTYLLVT